VFLPVSSYQNILSQFSNVQQSISQQDNLMSQLISYFINFENAKLPSPASSHSQSSSSQHAQQQHSSPSVFSHHGNGTVFLPRSESNRLINLNGTTTEEEVARASFEQMNEISLRARDAGFTFQVNGHPNTPGSNSGVYPPHVKQETVENSTPVSHLGKDDINARRNALESIQQEFKRIHTPIQQFPEVPPNHVLRQQTQPSGFEGYPNAQVNGSKQESSGLQVFTVGHIMPRGALEESGFGNASNVTSWQFDGDTLQPMSDELDPSANGPRVQQKYPSPPFKDRPDSPSMSVSRSEPVASTSTEGRPALRVRRSTFVPAWSVPPRVLLVEDDAVSRRLSSKFLQVFGCTIDVAVDGDSAVNKMNLEKYDLVLMVGRWFLFRYPKLKPPSVGYCHSQARRSFCNLVDP
jgi:osomolarity two-component system response regulator SKN7